MTVRCDEIQALIPRSLLGDLPPTEQLQLDQHIRECPACAAERASFEDVLVQLRSVGDEPVPRHFFIYPEERLARWVEVLRSPLWRLAAGSALLVLAVVFGLGISRFQFRAENGVYLMSFGKPLGSVTASSSVTRQDISALRTELLGLLEARPQQEDAEWMKVLRQEIEQAKHGFAEQQGRRWTAALNTLEARMNDRIEGTATVMKARMERSVGNMYQTLQLQRQQDLTQTRNRINQVATRRELKDQETEEILATLLQVADMRVGN